MCAGRIPCENSRQAVAPDSNSGAKHPAGTAAPGESRLVIGILTPYTTPLLFSIPGAFLISGTVASREGLPRLAPGGEAPLLVRVPPGQQTLVGPALEAGARSCLILPIHPKGVSCTLAHARAGNHPGRDALDLDQTEEDNP